MSAQETFQVDGIELGFGECSFNFNEGAMSVHLSARAAPHAARPDLFDSQYGYPQPGIRLEDITFPTLQCRITVPFEARPGGAGGGLWLDGFAGHRDLEGRVRIEGDVFELSGELRGDYGNEAGPQILIRKRFTPGEVDPLRFHHTDLDYALSLEPAFVGNLATGAWQNPRLDGLETLTNLRHLSLGGYDLAATFDAFDRLTKLKSLHLSGKELSALPPSICRLSSLERLSIEQASLASLPAEIGELAHLESLTIHRTQLREIPQSLLALPRLRHVDLQWNRLQSLPDLPESVAFRRIALKGNRFTRLPASLCRLEKVEIEPKLKPLYMDAGFKSPHRQPVATGALRPTDDTEFVQRFETALARHELTEYRQELRQVVRRSVLFSTTRADDYSKTGNTRFGGDPDLPSGFSWPASNGLHWLFLAQIDLAQIAPLQSYLPRDGVLSFLVNDLEYVKEVSVRHYPAGTRLQRTAPPVDAIFDQDPFRGFHATAEQAWSFPSLYGAERRFTGELRKLSEIERDDAIYDRYGTFCSEFARGREHGEDDLHGINVHVFTQNESPEEQAAERSGGQADEWIVLLSLGFDKKTGFCFWDAGTLSFMIHTRDLAAGDFSRVAASIESS